MINLEEICGCGDSKDRIIRDVIIIGCTKPRIKSSERVLKRLKLFLSTGIPAVCKHNGVLDD